MTPLPPFVEACTATMALIGRALMGSLPRSTYHDAWSALQHPAAYRPSDDVEEWVRLNWPALVAGTPGESRAVLPTDGQPVPEGIPTLPTISRARERWEDWMDAFLTKFVTSGGNVTKSAEAAGKHRDTCYEHRRKNPLFFAAWKEACKKARDRIRGALDDRGIVGWQEPVFGRVGKDQDGIVGYQWKYDAQALRLLALTHLPEFRAAREGKGASVTINNTANANAAASATAITAPDKLKRLQKGKNKQLSKAARRGALPKPPATT